LRTIREHLEHDERRRRTQPQFHAGRKLVQDRTGYRFLFEWKRTEGDVKRDAVGSSQQYHPMPKREVTSLLDTRREPAKQAIDVPHLVADTRENGQVRVSGNTGFAPMQHSDAADEAERPVVLLAERLDAA
jgi:hypothetical protein